MGPHRGAFLLLHRILAGCVLAILLVPAVADAAGFARVGTFGMSWELEYAGTRQAAMGQADIALETGPEALLRNPAALADGDGVAASYSRLDNFYVFTDDAIESFAATAAWSGFRVAACRMAVRADDVLHRTAYNPEGSDTVDQEDRLVVVGASYDLAHRLRNHPGQSVGGRHHGRHFDL